MLQHVHREAALLGPFIDRPQGEDGDRDGDDEPEPMARRHAMIAEGRRADVHRDQHRDADSYTRMYVANPVHDQK